MEGNLLQAIIQLLCYELWLSMDLFFKHLLMSVYGVLFAALIGIPLGILLARYTNFLICNYNCKYNSKQFQSLQC